MTTLGRRLIPVIRQRAAAVEAALVDLTDEQLWRRVTPTSNPVGNLILHLAGNLQTYIARGVGGRDYERDRPFEFQASDLPKAELAERFRAAVETVIEVLEGVSDTDLETPYQGSEYAGRDKASVALHSFEHLGYHTGQIAILSRILTTTG
jgi:uncharacterized damage-inducible protein DinB